MNQKILLVDDEPNVLSAFRRQLKKQFELVFAEGGAAAKKLIDESASFAVVVSDMQMPDVNGLELLSYVHEQSPETVRIMLTGNADQKTAVDAVNEGHIFRFLNKPCPAETLAKTLTAGLEQHRLVTAERELLSNTLNGSIDLMTEVLSMVNPTAFGRASRIRKLAAELCDQLEMADRWQIEIAASLSQIGCVTIPEDILDKYYKEQTLNADEQPMVNAHYQIAQGLVERIPRMENVAKIVGSGNQSVSEDSSDTVKLGSRMLDLLIHYDSLAMKMSPTDALTRLRNDERFQQDQSLLTALGMSIGGEFEVLSLEIDDLTAGMILDEAVETGTGTVIIGAGHQITDSLIARLENFAKTEAGVKQPIRVRKGD